MSSRPPTPPAPRPPLPIDPLLPELAATLREHPAAVLRAETGAGKTTRVPPALLALGVAQAGRVIMLEPRRIAARAAARRIAAEWGVDVGEEIGYQVRFDRRWGPRTRILVVTEGVLLRMLQADPFLDGVDVVIFDEFHERRLDSDLALAMARRVQEARPELRLLVMSATLEAQPVAKYLGDCPILESEGRRYPVEIAYREDAERTSQPTDPRRTAETVARAVPQAFEAAGGDLLVFLPGVGEIHRVASMLEGWSRAEGISVLPLYGDLASGKQDAALRRQDRPRVVLATNVAESSVTVEGVRGVVDSGLARTLRYDPACGLNRLELGRISRASADQRTGRAGREASGYCLRLWSEHEQRGLPAWDTPEVRRVDLAGAVLQLAAWGETAPSAFPWFEAPDAPVLEQAQELLRHLGALDSRGGATALGQALVKIPTQPRLARLLVEAQHRGCLRRGALAAALMAERLPFERGWQGGRGHSSSDLLDRVEALEQFRHRRHAPAGLKEGTAHHVLRSARQLAGAARRQVDGGNQPKAPDDEDSFEALSRCLLAAFPDRLARRREAGNPPAEAGGRGSGSEVRGLMVGGRGVRLAPSSSVRGAELFLCLDVDAGRRGERTEAWVRQASAVERDWLPEELLSTAVEAEFDPQRRRVVAWRRRRFLDLVVEETEHPVPEEQAAEVLAAAALEQPEAALALDDPEVASFLARVESLRHWRPELELPVFGRETWARLLPVLSVGRRSFDDLRKAPLLDFLQGMLTPPQQQALKREAPERWKVPSGSQIRLRYEPGKPPILAVRIQELFGLRETPKVAGGRVPVLMHLLAPNQRPQQVTQDLASFWENTYPEVRKELAGRYPKHAWPEDPLTATPEHRPRRKRS
ncbi:MAG: ATP-dependent helicase HrpB [Acidobacteriota bacterium]|nr:ATP-dependent helicase HrpB [Acidobacteriota bacterium]